MKHLKTLAIAILAFTTTTLVAQTKTINTAKSQIKWVGEKVTGKHEGTVNLSSGTLILDKQKIVGGTFTIAMPTLTVTDLTADQGKAKLEGHLKSEDFFDTETSPEAKLVFRSVAPKANQMYTVTADLTIKGITQPVTFDLKANSTTASTTFKVDRTKYDIKFKSGSFFDNLGDKAIYDDFTIAVNLVY
ncbi:YceI family protein [Flavobacterium ardleyense]|uniref:YceI family protein n=1 Tax=Flavobacterium ardleyense TaxID=2038737 RepID=UPI00298CB186|nr:YceI family protein [Flavobacterium ardleyense]